jgi:hypothetical protein
MRSGPPLRPALPASASVDSALAPSAAAGKQEGKRPVAFSVSCRIVLPQVPHEDRVAVFHLKGCRENKNRIYG